MMRMQQQRRGRGELTLGLVQEAQALVLLCVVLQSDAARGAAEGIDGREVGAVGYDLGVAKAEMEKLHRSKRALAGKVVVTNEREAVLAARVEEGGESTLVGRVYEAVGRTLQCFGE